jgi:hypothetical protein
MYHSNNKYHIDLHDDVEVKEAKLVKTEEGHEIHVRYAVKPGIDASEVRYAHTTNGVNHSTHEVAPVVEKESKKK